MDRGQLVERGEQRRVLSQELALRARQHGELVAQVADALAQA